MKQISILLMTAAIGIAGLGAGLSVGVPQASLGPKVISTEAGVDALSELRQELAQIRQVVRSTPTVPQASGVDPSLRKELGQLRADLARMATQLTGLQARQTTTRHGDEVTDTEAPDVPHDVIQAEQEIQDDDARADGRRHFQDIERSFAAEPVDQPLGRDVTARVTDMFTNDKTLGDLTLAEIDCRESRCRFEVWHDEGASLDDLTLALVAAMPDEPVNLAVDDHAHRLV